MRSTDFKFDIGQRVRFGDTNQDWIVYSRHYPEYGTQFQYYLQSLVNLNYQWVLEDDLRGANDA